MSYCSHGTHLIWEGATKCVCGALEKNASGEVYRVEDLQRAIVDLKKQLREVEADRDHYKALCQTLKDAPKPEYG